MARPLCTLCTNMWIRFYCCCSFHCCAKRCCCRCCSRREQVDWWLGLEAAWGFPAASQSKSERSTCAPGHLFRRVWHFAMFLKKLFWKFVFPEVRQFLPLPQSFKNLQNYPFEGGIKHLSGVLPIFLFRANKAADIKLHWIFGKTNRRGKKRKLSGNWWRCKFSSTHCTWQTWSGSSCWV